MGPKECLVPGEDLEMTVNKENLEVLDHLDHQVTWDLEVSLVSKEVQAQQVHQDILEN
jgi:hypothetical protein